MPLRWRPMRPKDVPECAEIVTAHPVIGPRYGRSGKNLRRAWMQLLGSEAMTTAVFEETKGTRVTMLGVGVGVFVSDDFIRELKGAPRFWFGPELANRVVARNSPVLSNREVQDANSGEGLNELVWETVIRSEFGARSEVYHLMGNTYIEIHRGYRFKEMITSQAESPERLQWALDAGGFYWDPGCGRYAKSLPRGAAELFAQPHIVGITREFELARPGSWVGALFDYVQPIFCLSRSEQQLLESALASEGGTDNELAASLSLSVYTIKQMWASIYRRVAVSSSDLLSDDDSLKSTSTERGKEKRRRLLAYIRQHPEELRPVSRKLLRRITPASDLGV
jgi:DNA-binding CsgD family transcriptional regulator